MATAKKAAKKKSRRTVMYSTGGKNTSTSRHASLWGTEIPCEHGEKWGHFIDLDHTVEESE